MIFAYKKGLITISELSYNIDELRSLCVLGKIKWTKHALKRFRERKIKSKDFINCIATGEIIESYPDSFIPSCLVLGDSPEKQKIHSVAGCDHVYVYAVTAYFPSCDEWENDLKTRR